MLFFLFSISIWDCDPLQKTLKKKNQTGSVTWLKLEDLNAAQGAVSGDTLPPSYLLAHEVRILLVVFIKKDKNVVLH